MNALFEIFHTELSKFPVGAGSYLKKRASFSAILTFKISRRRSVPVYLSPTAPTSYQGLFGCCAAIPLAQALTDSAFDWCVNNT